MILPIFLYGQSVLKEQCKEIKKGYPELDTLIENMWETMYGAQGVGLAAPQIGVMTRIFVMDCVKDEGEAPRPMVLMNPKITWASDEISSYEEGCLSIPEQYGDVQRPAEVEMHWMGLDGQLHQERFNGLWATCVQHELDHLNGKLFIDYLKPLRRQMITRKMQKLKREAARK